MERLLFKFYKSYFDVASELSDKDRLLFYDALMNKQFNGIEPKLMGMSKFAYISQKHSIDAQVKGWEDKTGMQLTPPSVPPSVPPSTEEEVKVKEKEEVKKESKKTSIPEFSEFKLYALENQPQTNILKLELKYKSWVESGWIDGNGKKIVNWKSKLLNTLPYLFDEKNKQRGSNGILA